jgi:hypothetical protein
MRPETGIYQPEALTLFESFGFKRRESFGGCPQDEVDCTLTPVDGTQLIATASHHPALPSRDQTSPAECVRPYARSQGQGSLKNLTQDVF